MVHAFNPSTWEAAEAGGFFETSLVYRVSSRKPKKEDEKKTTTEKENAAQVRLAGAGATVSPVGWSSDSKQSGSFLIHLKGQGKKTLGLAKMEEGAA